MLRTTIRSDNRLSVFLYFCMSHYSMDCSRQKVAARFVGKSAYTSSTTIWWSSIECQLVRAQWSLRDWNTLMLICHCCIKPDLWWMLLVSALTDAKVQVSDCETFSSAAGAIELVHRKSIFFPLETISCYLSRHLVSAIRHARWLLVSATEMLLSEGYAISANIWRMLSGT